MGSLPVADESLSARVNYAVTSVGDIRRPDEETVSGRISPRQWWGWVKKGGLSVLDQGLISGSNFLINVLLARWLVPEQYGAYAVAFSVFLFVSGFHNAFVLEPMSVIGPACHKAHLRVYLGRIMRLNAFTTVGLSSVLTVSIAVMVYLGGGVALRPALWGAGVATPFILTYWVCRRSSYLQMQPGVALRGAALYSVLILLLVVLCGRMGWLSAFSAFVLQALASCAAGSLLFVAIRPQSAVASAGPSARLVVTQHWKYGRWVAGTTMAAWLSGNAYYFLVGAFLRMRDVADLRALQNFVMPVTQFTAAITLLLLPWATTQYTEQPLRVFKQVVVRMTVLFAGCALLYVAVITLCEQRLVRAMYAGRYVDIAWLLPLAGVPLLFNAASQGAGIALSAMQRPSRVFYSYSVAAVISIVLGAPLTRYRGIPGTMLAMALASCGFAVVLAYGYVVELRRVTHGEGHPGISGPAPIR